MERALTLLIVYSLLAATAFAQSNAPQAPANRDSLIEGLLIGATAGAAAAYSFTRINCGPRGSDRECEAIVNLVGYPIFVPAGAVVGALIDRAIGNQRVAVVPTFNRRGASLNATIRLGARHANGVRP